MNKYSVRFYFHTYVDVEVEAENEEDALREANEEYGNRSNLDELINNMIECDEADVELIKED